MKKNLSLDGHATIAAVTFHWERKGAVAMKQREEKRRKKGQGWLTPRVISKQRRGWIAAATELIKFRSFAYYFSSPRRRRDANVCRNTPPPPWPRATSAIRVQTCSFFPYFPIPPPVSAKVSRIAQPSFVFGQRIFFPLIYRSPYSQF